MEVQFKETKKISIVGSYSAKAGSYGANSRPTRFEACRERFAKNWNRNTKGFYFKHYKDGGRNVAQFILKTEEILCEEVHSEFSLTNCTDVLWVAPSKFWSRCKMRRSLYTIFLRAGMNYQVEKDNYEEALWINGYANDTKLAIRRFLFGFTKYTGNQPSGSFTLESTGWVRLMKQQGKNNLKELLKSPKRKPYKPIFDLREEIWI